MGLFSSTKHLERLVESLEKRNAILEKDLAAVRERNEELVSRLLLKNQVPLTDSKFDKDTVSKLIGSASIFEEDDDPTPVEDNRKGIDAFAS